MGAFGNKEHIEKIEKKKTNLFVLSLFMWIPVFDQSITKTRLFKYIENFTTKKWKLSDEKFIFLLKI